jgi:uncharacterized protein (TIGR00251 family)
MLIKTIVKPNSNKSELVDLGENNFKAFLKSKPEKGKANTELIKLISKKFKVPKERIKLMSGLKSREKIIEIKE